MIKMIDWGDFPEKSEFYLTVVVDCAYTVGSQEYGIKVRRCFLSLISPLYCGVLYVHGSEVLGRSSSAIPCSARRKWFIDLLLQHTIPSLVT